MERFGRAEMAVRDLVEAAHSDAVEHTGSELANELQELLGQKMVAFAIGDRHPKSIGRYARGDREPDDETTKKLIDLYTVALILQARMRAETVRTWMLGTNPRLRGKAPIEMLHEGKINPVFAAAKAFVTTR
jgi:hypothetical protein